MKRSELKQILESGTEKSKRYFRLYPTLYRDLVLWEEYLCLVKNYRNAKMHSAKGRARSQILERWYIGENAFYIIHRTLRGLCEDV